MTEQGLTQSEYEERQADLLDRIERAQKWVWYVEGVRGSRRQVENAERRLQEAEDEYARFMEEAGQ